MYCLRILGPKWMHSMLRYACFLELHYSVGRRIDYRCSKITRTRHSTEVLPYIVEAKGRIGSVPALLLHYFGNHNCFLCLCQCHTGMHNSNHD